MNLLETGVQLTSFRAIIFACCLFAAQVTSTFAPAGQVEELIGARVTTIAGAPATVQSDETLYGYSNGAYYNAEDGEVGEAEFVVVDSPVGAIVPTLPDGAEQKTIGGADYFVYTGTYYQPFYSGSNAVYMVVAGPAG